MSIHPVLISAAAETGHHEVDQALSWAVGATALFILLVLLVGLIAFGGGREHT